MLDMADLNKKLLFLPLRVYVNTSHFMLSFCKT